MLDSTYWTVPTIATRASLPHRSHRVHGFRPGMSPKFGGTGGSADLAEHPQQPVVLANQICIGPTT